MKTYTPTIPASRLREIEARIRAQDAMPPEVARFVSIKQPTDARIKSVGKRVITEPVIDADTREEWPTPESCAANMGNGAERGRIIQCCSRNKKGANGRYRGRRLVYLKWFLKMGGDK